MGSSGGEVFVARKVSDRQPAWSVASLNPLEFTVTYCDGDLTGGVEDLERLIILCYVVFSCIVQLS